MELAVVAIDQQEAVGVESGGGASIAGDAVAGFDADALAGDPGAAVGGIEAVAGCGLRVAGGEGADFGVEGDEDGGGERFAVGTSCCPRRFASRAGRGREVRGGGRWRWSRVRGESWFG